MVEWAAGLPYQHSTSDGARPGPPLVLIHGAGGHHLSWPPQLRRLDGASVYALDLPGHGASEERPAAAISEYAERVLDWIRALELTDPVLAGHSMGGAVALMIAMRLPRLVAGLGLIGTAARLTVADQLLGKSADRRSFPAAVDWFIGRAFSPAAEPGLVARVRATAVELGHEVFHTDFAASAGFDVRARLGELELPAVVICGEDDRLTPPELSEELAAGLPQAELHRLSAAGHMVMLERPGAVAEILQRFLDQLSPTP